MKKNKKEDDTKSRLEGRLAEIRKYYINDPQVFYKVGDKVIHGAVKESHVIEILDEGKILKLHQTCVDRNYGNPKEYERDIHVCWHDVQPHKECSVTFLTTEDDIRFNTYQQMISSVILKYYQFGIDMSPDYQRGNVWELEDKQALIESIFNNIEIGKFSFIELPYKANSPSYEILDGKQRITALVEFYENRFEYKGYKYDDLSFQDQNHITNYNISVSTTKFMTDKQKYEYFLKLNTFGKPQDVEHIKYVQSLLK